MPILTINLEAGMPIVDVARQRMLAGLRSARAQRVAAVKLIHGYGSSGRGGSIKSEVRRQLETMRREGKIREFVCGDEFSPFSAAARHAIDLCPELARDRDYLRCNQGITVVVL